MKYGISVSDPKWDKIMKEARERASITGQRVKVQGFKNSPRASRYLGEIYSYLLMSPEHGHFTRACGVEGPNGKPCILPKGNHTVTHLCRGLDQGVYMAWFYLTDRNAPTSLQTNNIHSTFYTKEDLKNLGYAKYVD